jgi:protein associated with RNAse G/E
MNDVSAENPFTVVKLDHHKKEKIRYDGVFYQQLPSGVVIQAQWILATRDLGYVRFEPGDRFVEYYYTDHWFNIFEIYGRDGSLKGWYCNIAEPAQISEEQGQGWIKQVDLLLDVWINPQGRPSILDEDEFAASDLNEQQRKEAQQGLQVLLQMLETYQGTFSILKRTNQKTEFMHKQ